MAIKKDEVFEHFLSLIEDLKWLSIEDEALDRLMQIYLKSAISSFTQCRNKITLQSDGTFNVELSPLEVKILARGMLLEYLMPKIVCQQNLENHISTKDYNDFSKANMLGNLIDLQENIQNQYDRLVAEYDYDDFQGLN